MEKIAVFAPMHRASVTRADVANPLFFDSVRHAKRTSPRSPVNQRDGHAARVCFGKATEPRSVLMTLHPPDAYHPSFVATLSNSPSRSDDVFQTSDILKEPGWYVF